MYRDTHYIDIHQDHPTNSLFGPASYSSRPYGIRRTVQSFSKLAKFGATAAGLAGSLLAPKSSRKRLREPIRSQKKDQSSVKRFRGSSAPVLSKSISKARVSPSVAKQETMPRKFYRKRKYRQMRTRRKKVMTTGRGVTSEHDRQFIYRKKRMSRGRKRRWRGFKRKVNAVAEKNLGSRTVVFNRSIAPTNNNTARHNIFNVALYSNQSTDSWMNDLNNISQLENAADPTAVGGVTVDDTTKFIFQSGVLDLTMRNTSFLSVGGGLEPQCTLEVDVYEMACGRRLIDRTTGGVAREYKNLIEAYAQGEADTKNIGGAVLTTDLSLINRGVTPWDVPTALSQFRLKIIKKTKMFIKSGQTATYQMRDPKRKVFSRGFMRETYGPNIPKKTHHLLVIAKAVPGVTVGTATGQVSEQLTVGITRKYMYKIEGVNEARDSYQSI